MKKICFITSSRADYGMVEIMVNEALNYKKKYQIFLIISGNHNDNFFGKSINEIKFKKKIKIYRVFSNQRNKNLLSVALSFSKFLKKFSHCLKKINPDVFIVFGDRYEMLSATLSAFILGVPIVHLAGGEKTSGSLDDGFRHSITKLSNLHFPTSNIHKKRIIQLGEHSKTVFNFGSLNKQKIVNTNFLTKAKLEKKFKIKFFKKNILMTLHPEKISIKKNLENLKILLECLNILKDTRIIITSPNADAGGVEMVNLIKNFIRKKNKFTFIKSFGSVGYLSMLRHIDGVIGNSSSGISEVPLFSIKSINLGNRQKGREINKSVISCKFNKKIILKSLKKLKKNNTSIKIMKRDKLVAKKILKKIIKFNFKKKSNKEFKDLKFNI